MLFSVEQFFRDKRFQLWNHLIYHKHRHLNDLIIITKQEKGTYLLSVGIMSGLNKVSFYLSLTLRNFILPKNLHLSYFPKLRVLSIDIAPGKELAEFLMPIFSSSFYLQGFPVTNCCFYVVSHTHLSNYIYFTLKQNIFAA